MAGELLPTLPEHRLSDIEVVLPTLRHCLQDHVNMGMRLVGVEREDIAMPIGECLLREIAYRRQEFVDRCPCGHREENLVHELRSRASPRYQIGLTPVKLVQIKVPAVLTLPD